MLDGLADLTLVEDGLAAVEAYSGGRFDVVLMDIQMPRLDGIGAVARIRALEAAEGRPETPVIMLTANTQSEHVAASRAAGADRHIGKPFTAAVLLDAIRACCPKARRRRPATARLDLKGAGGGSHAAAHAGGAVRCDAVRRRARGACAVTRSTGSVCSNW